MHEFPIPSNNQPLRMTLGQDNNLWFTEYYANQIGKITLAGVITEYPLPPEAANPDGITTGPDHALWFAGGTSIGRMTTDGVVTDTYPVPTPDSKPEAIITGPDGNLWFTESSAAQIGRVTVTGTFTEFPVLDNSFIPDQITAGPDGALWYTNGQGHDVVSRITTAGAITDYPMPTTSFGLAGVGSGADCNVWVSEVNGVSAAAIGRVGTGLDLTDGTCTAPTPAPAPVVVPPTPVTIVPQFTG
jgi:virginiamycin B lyase